MIRARLHRLIHRTWIGVLLLSAALYFFPSPLRGHPETASALAELSAQIAKEGSNAALYLRRAACWEEHANWPAAEADLKRAAALAPTFLAPRLELARLYGETGRETEARRELDLVLAARPTQPEALLLRGRALARLGFIDEAYADYTVAITTLIEPRPEVFLERAALPIDPKTALAGIEQGIERLGPALTLVNRAIDLELRLGRVDAALARIDQITTRTERPETWWHRRGVILEKAGRWAEARLSYENALAAVDRLPSWLRGSSEILSLSAELHHLIAACPPPS